MTVQSTEYSEIKCQWFAGKKLEEGYFPPGSLIRVIVDEEKE